PPPSTAAVDSRRKSPPPEATRDYRTQSHSPVPSRVLPSSGPSSQQHNPAPLCLAVPACSFPLIDRGNEEANRATIGTVEVVLALASRGVKVLVAVRGRRAAEDGERAKSAAGQSRKALRRKRRRKLMEAGLGWWGQVQTPLRRAHATERHLWAGPEAYGNLEKSRSRETLSLQQNLPHE
ncbi:hypothetical protein STAS_29739, partial [Striga asiatica]